MMMRCLPAGRATIPLLLAVAAIWAALSASARADLVLTELMYHPVANENEEYLEFTNTGDVAIDLGGLTFTKGLTYTFPDETMLDAGAYLVLAKNVTAFKAAYGASARVIGPYAGQLSNSGETVLLDNEQGKSIVEIEYETDGEWPKRADGAGSSLEMVNVTRDQDSALNWRASGWPGGSPGRANPAPIIDVVINEVLSNAADPMEDAIELHNTSGAAIDIGGWWLSDDNDDLAQYKIPGGTVIAPGGFYVVYERQFNTQNPGVPFALNSAGEHVYLCEPNDDEVERFADDVGFDAADRGVSIGRKTTSLGVDFVPLQTRTFDPARPELNPPASLAEFRQGTGEVNTEPVRGPIIFNEVMYHPPDVVEDIDNTLHEYIELYNASASAVTLYNSTGGNGWTLSGGVDFTFSQSTTIPSRGRLLVVSFNPATDAAALANFKAAYPAIPAGTPIVGPWTGKLDNNGELLRLYRPLAPLADLTVPRVLVDQLRYNDNDPWPDEADGEGASLECRSVLRYGNELTNWAAGPDGGTPGRLNGAQAAADPAWLEDGGQ